MNVQWKNLHMSAVFKTLFPVPNLFLPVIQIFSSYSQEFLLIFMLNLLSKHLKNIIILWTWIWCRISVVLEFQLHCITFFIILFWQTLLFESLVSLDETFKSLFFDPTNLKFFHQCCQPLKLNQKALCLLETHLHCHLEYPEIKKKNTSGFVANNLIKIQNKHIQIELASINN